MDTKFDRSKPFYPYIITYITALYGTVDLLSRSIDAEVHNVKDPKAIKNLFDINKCDPSTIKTLKEFADSDGKRPLLGNGTLALKSIYLGKPIEVNINELAKEFLKNFNYLLPFQINAASGLLVTCYEISKDKFIKGSELWNFFYHCRNAAAHKNTFNITNLDRFPAQFGKLIIKQELNGTRLFYDPTQGGLLGLGDPIQLLLEIERMSM